MSARDPHRPSTGLIVGASIGLILWIVGGVLILSAWGAP